jgi:SAM-dependent methyltransferase
LGREFDVVVCADILEHLPSPEELLAAIHKWLKPGGVLLVSLPNVANITVRLSLLLGRFSYAERGILDRTHLRFFTKRTARALLEDAGFRVNRIVPSAMPAELAVRALGHFPLRGVSRGSLSAAARLWPSLFGYQFLLEATPR